MLPLRLSALALPQPSATRAWGANALRRTAGVGMLTLFLSWAMPAGASATKPIEFQGVLVQASTVSVALHDPASGGTKWVQVGEKFGAYHVVAFDAATETLILRQGADEIRLRLNSASLASAPDSSAAPASPAARKIAAQLRHLAAAATQFFRDTGRGHAALGDLVGPGKYIAALRPVCGEDYNVLHFDREKMRLSVTTSDGERVTLDPQTPDPDRSQFHLFKEGDSLARIAETSGTSLQRILELNELAEPGGARAGRLLRLR
ncbi:MAG: LysM peptidoglycan-binding domain-containing protein [Opitutae bacterium]|nr:LysM peptidoglycan-binding domain-containing protein [Opitutae bacterium]